MAFTMTKIRMFLMFLGLFFGAVQGQSFVLSTVPPLAGGNGLGAIAFTVTASNVIRIDSLAGAFAGTTPGPIEVWSKPGGLGSVPTVDAVNGWTLHGSAVMTPQSASNSSPVLQVIPVNVGVVITPGQTYSFAFGRPSGASTPTTIYTTYSTALPSTVSDANLTINLTPGQSYGGNFPGPNLDRMFNGTIYYTPQTTPGTNLLAQGLTVGSTCPGTTTLSMGVFNIGSTQVTNGTIQWQINGVSQPAVPFSQLVDTIGSVNGFSGNLPIGNVVMPSVGTPLTIKAWTSLPNGVADSDPTNDTVTAVFNSSLNGTFTLDPLLPSGGGNFQTLNAFASALSQFGVCGPVVLNVSPGVTLNEQVIFNTIPGSSSTNTIRINGQNATVSFSPTTSDRHVLRFSGASFVTVENLNVLVTAPDFGYGIHFINNCRFDTIRNCSISFPNLTTTTTTATAGILASASLTSNVSSGLTCSYCALEGNTISGTGSAVGPYYGVSWYGTGLTGTNGSRIVNNIVRDFRFGGIRVNNGDTIEVSGNEVSRPTITNITTYYGLYATGTINNLRMFNNKVHSPAGTPSSSTSVVYGIYTSADATSVGPNIIANNLVYNLNLNGTEYGIYGASPDHNYIYHNTVVQDNSAATTSSLSAGVFISGIGAGAQVLNNLFVNSRGGTGPKYGIYYSANGVVTTSNNNLVFINATNPNFGFIGTAQATQSAFVATSGGNYDVNSLTIDPQFNNPAILDYTPTNLLVNGAGFGLQSIVPQDINGNARPTLPDPGAFESPGAAYDLQVSSILQPSGSICASADSVRVRVLNNGFNVVNTAQVEWSVNGIAQVPVNLSGLGLSNGQFADVTLGLGSFIGQGPFVIRANSRIPNGNPDQVPQNDTSAVTLFAGMQGIYTLDPNQPISATNFQTMGSFAQALSQRGVCAAVELQVLPTAVLTEQVSFTAVPGASATRNIHVRGQGATLQFAPISPSFAVLQFNSASYFTVDSLRIATTGTTTGYGVHFTNGSSYDTLRFCTIDISSITSTTALNSGGIIGSSSPTSNTTAGNICNYCSIESNRIEGGVAGGMYYGIRLNGNPDGSGLQRTRIVNNEIANPYFYGIYLMAGDSVEVARNLVHRPTKQTITTFYGIYLTGDGTNYRVHANRVKNPVNTLTSTSTVYGIYSALDATPTGPNLFYNNLISDFNSNGIQYGLYGASPEHNYFYHNTVSLDHQGGTSSSSIYGVYFSGASVGTQFVNNMVSVTRNSSGSKFGLYLSSGTALAVSDYNNIWVSGTGTNLYGYLSANRITRADFNLASGLLNLEANSDTLNPNFVNPLLDDYTPGNLFLNGQGTNLQNLVPNDILGVARPTTPDMGAFEFVPAPNDASLIALISPTTTFCSGTQPVTIRLGNPGNATLNSVTVVLTSNGQPVLSTNLSGLGLASGNDTILTVGTYNLSGSGPLNLQAYVSLPNNTPDLNNLNDTINLVAYNGLSGAYTLNNLLPTGGVNFQSFFALDSTLALRGLCGPVDVFVQPGQTFNEQVLFQNYPTASIQRRIRIHGQGATVSFAPSSTLEYVMAFNGGSFIRVDSLNIVGTSATAGIGVLFLNQAAHDTLVDCTIDLSAVTSTSSTASTGIAASGSFSSPSTAGTNLSNSAFIRNRIIGGAGGGGYNGIRLNGLTNGTGVEDILIQDNIISDFYLYGIYLNNTDSVRIRGNDISRANRTALSTFYGIAVFGNSNRVWAEGNLVHDAFNANPASTSTTYGLYSSATPTLGRTVNFVNNKVYNMNGNGIQYGIYGSTPANTRFYHNTIVLDQSLVGTSAAYGMYFTGAGAGLEALNNLIYMTRNTSSTSYGMYFTTSATPARLDHQVVYMSNATGAAAYGFISNALQQTRIDFFQASGGNAFEGNSVEADPFFLNPQTGNYQPTNPLVNNTGLSLSPVVTTDYFGNPRSLTPDAGAIEWSPAQNDAGVAQLVQPGGPVCPGNQSVLAIITNAGLDTLQTVQVNWEVNGVGQPPASFTGLGLATTQDSLLNLGNFNFLPGLAYTLKIWTSAPNGQADAQPLNDTLVLTMNPGMLGTYTVDAGSPISATNFLSIPDAITALANAGVCGPVIVDVVTPIHNTPVVIPPISGTSAVNTITLQSQAQDSSAVTLVVNGTSSLNYALRLDGCSFVRVRHLTLQNTNGSNARVLEIRPNTSDNEVSHCRLIGDSLSTTLSTLRANIYALGVGMQRNVIRQNRIVGGGYGVYWYGNTSGNNTDNQLENNFFTTQVFYAGDFRYHTGLTLHGNEVRFNTGVTVQTYGFRVLDAATGLKVTANLIVGSGDHPYNSIRVEGGVAAVPALVANNMLVSGSANTVSTLFQLYLTNVSNVQVVHNSATLLGNATGSSHLYAGNVSGLDLLNNNFTNAIGASVWFMDANVSLGQSNHNNLYTTAFTPFFWNGIGLSNLAAWQTTTSSDANSISVPPSFFGVDDLHTCDPALASAGIAVPSVPADFDGEVRSTLTPSIGADEFAVNPVYSLGPDIQKCANASIVLSGNPVFGATYTWNTGATTPTLSVTTPGLYHVTVTTVCGSTTDSILVSSLPGPVVSFSHVVSGSTVTFTNTSPGSGLTFNWDFGDGNGAVTENPVYTYSVPGNYNVTLTVTDSCGVSNSAVQLVDANPCIPIGVGFTSAVNGATVSFTQTSTGTGLASAWDFGDGNTSNQTNPTHTYANPGTYTVLLTVTDSCGFTDTLSAQVTVATSGLEEGPSSGIVAYPNPSNTFVVVRSTSDQTIQYRLMDPTGREVRIGIWASGQGVLDVAQLPSATYVLELLQAGKRHVISVVVQGQ